MRWVTFQYDGRWRPGAVQDDGSIVPVPDPRSAGAPGPLDMLDVIHMWSTGSAQLDRAVRTAPANGRLDRRAVVLGPPVPRPGKLLCLAGNYREHIVESGFAPVAERDVITPQMFLKPSTCLAGDGAEVALLPENVRVGWEAELAVVIGRPARRVDRGSALAHVFGYTILNDLSERGFNSRLQGRRVRERDPFFDWLAGKWFDGFAPCGPWIVTADEIPDPQSLGIRLRLNGELRQEGHSSDMIFDVAALVAHASAIMTLEPGDIIATGTPAGAGIGTGDSFVRPGDEVVCEIDRIGALRTPIGSLV